MRLSSHTAHLEYKTGMDQSCPEIDRTGLLGNRIEAQGRHESPAELASHECIIFTRLPTPYHRTFTKNKREERIQVKGQLKTKNADAVRTAMLEGTGVGSVSSFLVGGDIKAGRLEHLLPTMTVALPAFMQSTRIGTTNRPGCACLMIFSPRI